MRSVARLAGVGTASLALAACAVLAGLDDPKAVDDATASSSSGGSSGSLQDTGNGSSSGGGTSSSGDTSPIDSSTDGASSSGAPADAEADVAACMLGKIGDNCTMHSGCCSNKCNEKRLCASDCKQANMFNCNPTSDSDCCIGLYCSGFSCVPCIVAGQPPAAPGGLPNPRSCCGRSINLNGTCN